MEGNARLSRRVASDEPELIRLIADVLAIADGREVTWAMDMTGGEPGLLINLLVNHGQELVYISGVAVNRATDSYRGQGKTDARDARVIADQARMRRDLQPVRLDGEAVIELRLLTERRADLVADRTRVTNRLRSLLNSMFPAVERALDLGNAGPLRLLAGYQTPAAIRRAGSKRLATWLRNRKVYGAEALAAKAVEAAERQHRAVAGEKAIGKMVHTLAEEVMALNEKIAGTDKLIEGTVSRARARRSDHLRARYRGDPRRGVPRRRRRKPGRLPHPGPACRVRRRLPGPEGLGQGQR